WGDRLPMVVAGPDPSDAGPFGVEVVPLDAALEHRIRTALDSGNKVLLAADMLFQPREVWSEAEALARQQALQGFVTKYFALKPPLVSPSGQYYYPLAIRARRAVRP